MQVSPISFGSLMIGTLKSGRPKLPVPTLINLAFTSDTINISGKEQKNPLLRYELTQPMKQYKEKIDGTVHNANLSFAQQLNNEYRPNMPKGSNKIILTEANFYINPRDTEKRYFITAATDRDEKELHKILSRSKAFYTVRYR